MAALEHKKILAGAEPTHTAKGLYIGVGEGPEKIAEYKAALTKAGYVEGNDFTTKPSILNSGKDVISFSGEAGARFTAQHESLRLAAQPTPAAAPPKAVIPAAIPLDLDLNQPTPAKPPALEKHVEQAIRFNNESRLPETEKIAYGYKDGGRQAQYGDEMKTVIGTRTRESIEVKSPDQDPTLKKAIDFAKVKMAGMTATEQKAKFLSQYVGELLHNGGDFNSHEARLKTIPDNENGKGRVSLGQLIEAEVGVCRHRSLLFKVLADETGVPTALVRGQFQGPRESGAHAWNEVLLENGKKLLVDATHGKVMHMDDDYARQYQHLNKKPMYDNNGLIDYKAQQQAATAKPAATAPPVIQQHQKILAGVEPTHTAKGVYLGVGEGPEKIAQYKDALAKAGYIEGQDFTTKPSSLNGGKDVISLSGEAGSRFAAQHESLRASGAHLAAQVAAPQAGAPPKAAPVAAPVDLDHGKPVTPQSAMADAAARAREQLARQNAEKPQYHMDKAAENARAQLAGIGSKVEGKVGKATTYGDAALKAASGDVAGAAMVVAQAKATDVAVKAGGKVAASFIPGGAAIVAAGVGLFSAGEAAAQGNFKKAGTEVVATVADTVGGIVGFGAGNALREGTRKVFEKLGVKEENLPGKSAVRELAETAYTLGKGTVDKAKFGSMDQKTLASTIASDPTLHKTINRGGVATPLADALKDKTFRADYLKTLEQQTASGQHDRSTQIAAIKAYGEKVDAAAPAQTAAAPAKPAAVAQAASPAAPAASAQQVAQYKGMSTGQLGAAIQRDDTLPDTVKMGGKDGKEVPLAEALKDKDFRKNLITNLESAQAKGSDLSTQIAMIKAYGDKLDNDQKRPTITASAPAPSITAPMA